MSFHSENGAKRTVAGDSAEIDIKNARLLADQQGKAGEENFAPQRDDPIEHTLDYDREKIAAFMLENGPRIRRRVRGKLGVMMRRTVDSEDILSTVIRRLDRYAASGQLRAQSDGELWALVLKITDAALTDKVRKKERQRRLQEENFLNLEYGEGSDASTSALSDCDPKPRTESLFAQAIDSRNGTDAEITMLWARGLSHASIAAAMGQEACEVRSRWQLIKRRLRRRGG